jgi:hypothetical protein
MQFLKREAKLSAKNQILLIYFCFALLVSLSYVKILNPLFSCSCNKRHTPGAFPSVKSSLLQFKSAARQLTTLISIVILKYLELRRQEADFKMKRFESTWNTHRFRRTTVLLEKHWRKNPVLQVQGCLRRTSSI